MSTAKVIPMHDNKLLAAAIGYAAIGWRILPAWWIQDGACACGNIECKSPGKHPIGKVAPFGQNSASIDVEKIRKWWEQYPQANIACFLEPSGLCAIDIDPRNGGIQTIEDIEAKYGPLTSDLLQYTGGGGEHRFFQKPSSLSLPGKLGPGVDVKLNGYTMMEPSNHISGKTYVWEASSDPRDGMLASPLPDWLRDLAWQKMQSSAPEVQGTQRVVFVTKAQKSEIAQALEAIPSDVRDIWLSVGMALQSTGDHQWAFETWDRWSSKSRKYDPVDLTRVWRSFRAKGLDGVTYKTIFALAKEQGVTIAPAIQEPEPTSAPVNIAQPPAQIPQPATLLAPEGILGAVTNWVNATARKSQPMFAVQAAIAFCSTVLGRRYVTTNRNWPSLYLLNIGKSASGKEHAKWAVEHLLESCNLHSLIGPSSYTSSAGLLSALHDQPSHITVIDEFGKELEQASVKGNARAQSTMKALIETWGRCNGVLRPQGYSTFGMSATDAAKIKERSVRCPALTLLGMTTPDTFFDTIGSAAARDGFLNRFLIVESDIGRQASSINQAPPTVPQEIIDWATAVQAATNGALNQATSPSLEPAPVVVGLSRAAKQIFAEFEVECLGLMDQFEANGLAEMYGRCNEIAMRLALTVAVGRFGAKPGDIEGQDATWAVQYVRYHAARTVQRLVTSVFDSEFEAAKQQVMKVFTDKGKRGLTVRELGLFSRRFNGMTKRQQIELLDSLKFMGKVDFVAIGKRNVWVAVDSDGAEDDGGPNA